MTLCLERQRANLGLCDRSAMMANRRSCRGTNRALLVTAVFVVAVACGESAKENGSRGSRSDAGESGEGQAGDPGGRGGAAGTSNGGLDVGGESSGGTQSRGGRGGSPSAGQGGSAPAGASSGGSAGASTAGAGSVTTPDGCTLTSHLLGGLYCSMAMTCGSETVLISCQEDSGDWRCGCVRGNVRPDFHYFPDVTGMRTCEVSATACLHPELLDADEVCTLTDDATSSYSCTATDSCARPHRVDGVTLETRSEWTASCELCGTTPHACCRCVENGFPEYRLRASDIDDGCLYLDELCRGNGEITPLGGDTCETLGEESMPGQYCNVATTCEYPSELADGTLVTLAGAFEASCMPLEDTSLGDVTLCTCIDQDGWQVQNVVYDPPGLFLANCIDTNRACAGLVSVEPIGAVDCTDSIGEYEIDYYCSRGRRCFQPGTLLGTEVRAITGTDVSCMLRGDGGWSCNCHDQLKNQEPVRIELDEAADPESACAEAIDECPVVSKATF